MSVVIKIYYKETKFCNNKREGVLTNHWFTVAIGSKGCENCLNFGGHGEDENGRYVLCGD